MIVPKLLNITKVKSDKSCQILKKFSKIVKSIFINKIITVLFLHVYVLKSFR